MPANDSAIEKLCQEAEVPAGDNGQSAQRGAYYLRQLRVMNGSSATRQYPPTDSDRETTGKVRFARNPDIIRHLSVWKASPESRLPCYFARAFVVSLSSTGISPTANGVPSSSPMDGRGFWGCLVPSRVS